MQVTKIVVEDELCTGCRRCHYNPNGPSMCELDFPGARNNVDAVIACDGLLLGQPQVLEQQ